MVVACEEGAEVGLEGSVGQVADVMVFRDIQLIIPFRETVMDRRLKRDRGCEHEYGDQPPRRGQGDAARWLRLAPRYLPWETMLPLSHASLSNLAGHEELIFFFKQKPAYEMPK